MHRRVGVIAVVLLGIGVGCSDSGGVSASAFVDNVDDVCRDLDGDLADLDAPQSLADVPAFAAGASKAYEAALADLKRLKVPSDADSVADAKDLVANFDDQITVLDAIVVASAAGDDTEVTDKIAEFTGLYDDDNKIADSLGARRCSLDPMFAFEVAPPVTEPPVTDPPVTDPPETLPPETLPPDTVAPSDSNKTSLPLASELPATGGYTFGDTDETIVQTFTLLLDISPMTAAQSGSVAGVEVVNSAGDTVARVFIYLPDDALPAGAIDELTPLFVGDATTIPLSYAQITGVGYTTENGVFFVGSNDPSNAGVVVWAVGADQTGLDAGLNAFVSALGG